MPAVWFAKYSPPNYNEYGEYTVEEWTSVEDIGKTYQGSTLTKEQYLDVENKYIEVLLIIIEQYFDGNPCTVSWGGSIEDVPGYQNYLFSLKPGVTCFPNNQRLEGEDLELYLRMCLRGLDGYGLTDHKKSAIALLDNLYIKTFHLDCEIDITSKLDEVGLHNLTKYKIGSQPRSIQEFFDFF